LDRLQLELQAVQGRSLAHDTVAEFARITYTTLEKVCLLSLHDYQMAAVNAMVGAGPRCLRRVASLGTLVFHHHH
jgi:hypothetical protein